MKPPGDFHRRKLKSGGFTLSSWCKVCARAKALECANRRYREDPEWRAQKLVRESEEGAKKRAAYRLEYPFLTPEERKEHNRIAGRKHSKTPAAQERNRVHARNYRALKKMQAEGVPITKEGWKEILEKYDHRCAYCKLQTDFLELDHITPLSRGGAHSIKNVAPACRACNTSKNNKTLDEWTPPTEPQKDIWSKGKRGPWKLSDERVIELRHRRENGEQVRALAREFGVHEQTVSDITRGRKRVLVP
jgi:5-methylcytosine-specific restriction endonuclease McrA